MGKVMGSSVVGVMKSSVANELMKRSSVAGEVMVGCSVTMTPFVAATHLMGFVDAGDLVFASAAGFFTPSSIAGKLAFLFGVCFFIPSTDRQ